MAYRLSRISTRTGDDGTTGLADGKRVTKDDPRIEVIGAVDELNSALGLLLSETLPDEVRIVITSVQHALFDLGGELSLPGHVALAESRVTELDAAVERYNAELPPLREFVLPGGTRAAALAHLARAVCRRAERQLVTLSRREAVQPAALGYLNRLSDLLFVLARTLNRRAGVEELLWQSSRSSNRP
jgi:cob(I)alamin adenosyltransferase